MARLKNGVCECEVSEDGSIIPNKSIKLYYEGIIDEERLKIEIIPDINDHLKRGWRSQFPMLVYSYYSGSNSDLATIKGKGGLRFKPAKPKKGTKSYDWLIYEDGTTIRIDQLKISSKQQKNPIN